MYTPQITAQFKLLPLAGARRLAPNPLPAAVPSLLPPATRPLPPHPLVLPPSARAQEVDGRLLQLKVAPTTPALRTRVGPMFSGRAAARPLIGSAPRQIIPPLRPGPPLISPSPPPQAIICMSRKPDSRRTPASDGNAAAARHLPYEVGVGDPRRVPPAPPNIQSLQHAAHAAAQGFPLGHVAPGSRPMGLPGRPVAALPMRSAISGAPGPPSQAQAAQAAQARARGCYPNRAAAPGEPWKPDLKPAPPPPGARAG